MMLIVGRDRSLVSAVTEHLSNSGRDFAWTEPEALFERAFRLNADAIVLLESAPLGAADDQVLRDALGAMSAPGSRKTFVLVSPRDDHDLDAVRRNGASYVVLRVCEVVALDGVTRGATFAVPSDVVEKTRHMVDAGTVARAVLEAIDADELVGRVVDLEPPPAGPIVRAIECAGGRARVLPGIAARALSVFIGRAVDLDRKGRPFVSAPMAA